MAWYHPSHGVLIVGRKRRERVLDVYVGSSKVGLYSHAPSGRE